MERCKHCGGNIIPDGSYHLGLKEDHLKCLQCGREHMGLMTEKKKCVDCGNDYQPSSNVQKRCLECANKHKIIRDREWRRKRAEKAGRTIGRNKRPPAPRPSDIAAGMNILVNNVLDEARKIVAKEMIAHLQATFLEG